MRRYKQIKIVIKIVSYNYFKSKIFATSVMLKFFSQQEICKKFF